MSRSGCIVIVDGRAGRSEVWLPENVSWCFTVFLQTFFIDLTRPQGHSGTVEVEASGNRNG